MKEFAPSSSVSLEKAPLSTIVVPPIADQLGVPAENSPWPSGVITSSEVHEQVVLRNILGAMFSELSVRARADVAIGTLLKERILHEDEAISLYKKLTQFFETAEQSERVVLYFPFELLPPTTLQVNNEELSEAMQRFAATFMTRWRTMLSVRDVKANFVDGDVLEVELRTGDLPRVVKAAHLAPVLVDKGYISADEVLQMATDSTDPILQASVVDTLPLLCAMGHVKKETLAKYGLPTFEYRKESISTPRSVTEIFDTFLRSQTTAPTISSDATVARRAWLEKQQTDRLIQQTGEQLAHVFGSRDEIHLTDDMLQHDTFMSACIVGLRRACEQLGTSDVHDAKSLFDTYAPLLSQIMHGSKANAHVHDVVRGMYSSLVALRVLPVEATQGYRLPTFTTALVTNLEPIQEDVRVVHERALSIEHHPYLSTKIFPVALLFGSQVKGYGLSQADADVAVFVRPGTLPAERPAIQKALAQVFEHHKVQGKAVEFWLDARGDEWTVHDSSNPDRLMADSSWTHVLCGAAWCGNQDTIKELQRRVLPRYAKAPRTNEEAHERARWLEEMERDFLQYRLLHRGYAYYSPTLIPPTIAITTTIDGQSAFWDSGYRRTATEIFIRRVFLPAGSHV